MAKPAGEKVPKQMQDKFEEITKLTDAFCSQYLNAEYTDTESGLVTPLIDWIRQGAGGRRQEEI